MNNGRKRIIHRPNKVSSALGAVIGVIFVIIGITVVIPMAGWFGVLWTFVAGVITAMSIFYALGKKFGGHDIYSHEMIIEDMEPSGVDVETRLNKLGELYERRVITKEEYEKKRREILEEL